MCDMLSQVVATIEGRPAHNGVQRQHHRQVASCCVPVFMVQSATVCYVASLPDMVFGGILAPYDLIYNQHAADGLDMSATAVQGGSNVVPSPKRYALCANVQASKHKPPAQQWCKH